MHHEVNLVPSVGYTWKGIECSCIRTADVRYIPLLSHLGCFRNGLRVISYFISLKLQARQDQDQLSCFLVLFLFRHIFPLTFSFLTPSRSNVDSETIETRPSCLQTCIFLVFHFLVLSLFILVIKSILVCWLRLCSFVRRRRNKGLLEFLEACALLHEEQIIRSELGRNLWYYRRSKINSFVALRWKMYYTASLRGGIV
jgi:hypothetical protein